MAIVKKNLTTFFLKLENALKSNDIDAIKKIIHKVSPTVKMLELDSLNVLLIEIGRLENINSDVLSDLLNQLKLEKKIVADKGWI